MEEKKVVNAIDALLDENNTDNVTIYDENDKPYEFEQIAIIPHKERLFAILKALEDKVANNDYAYVFELKGGETEDDEPMLELIDDETLIDEVFNEYYKLLKEDKEGK